MATPKKISDIKPLFTNLAQTSHYQVQFGGIPLPLTTYLAKKGVTSRFIAEDAGLLCYSAVLPTTNLATATVTGNFMGLTENFAHSRQYGEISLDFYVDSNYNAIKFIEGWMEFIASGSNNPLNSPLQPLSQNRKDYIFRMQYPEYYKTNLTKIVKFDRDYKKEIEYGFVGLFPKSISSIPVSYQSSDVLRMSVNFSYDRYISGKFLSLDIFNNVNNNNQPNQKQESTIPQNILEGTFNSTTSLTDLERLSQNFNASKFGINPTFDALPTNPVNE